MVFALVRNVEGATDLRQLASERKNIQIVQLDVDKHKSIDVRVFLHNASDVEALTDVLSIFRQLRNKCPPLTEASWTY